MQGMHTYYTLLYKKRKIKYIIKYISTVHTMHYSQKEI